MRLHYSIHFAAGLLAALLFVFGGKQLVYADALTEIADDVLNQTVFKLPVSDSDPRPSRYNLWMYQNFMIMEGMSALGKVTGDDRYRTYADRNIDFFAAYQSEIGDTMTAGPAGLNKWYSQPHHMWQCGMIAAFAERHQTSPHPEFLRGMEIFDALLERSPAFDDGVLVRMKGGELGLGLQIDDLYMIAPYWCRKGELLKDSRWLDRAIDEALHYFDYLWDEEDRLMHCLWLRKNKAPYGLYWGRGNGWYIMAVTDLLTFIPADHPKRQAVLDDYRSFIEGIVLRQDKENGLWHQLLDRPDSYSETSCSGMFTYCILKGVNEGWLDGSYFKAGERGWQGLQGKVTDDFRITGVCPPTDMSTDPDYYLKRGPKTHDQHAIGPFLLSGAAYLEALKSQ